MSKKSKGKFTIPTNQHVFIAGATGSGKSFLVKKYLSSYPFVVCLDIKGDVAWPELEGTRWNDKELIDGGEVLTITESIDQLSRIETPKVIYRPRWEELDFDTINRFFQWVYLRQNCIVWVDEVMDEAICKNPYSIPPYYKAILTRGRSRNTAAWSISQRPSGIHPTVMSEASHFFVFHLNLQADRNKVAYITGHDEFLQNPKERFAFWYLNVREPGSRPTELILSEKRK